LSISPIEAAPNATMSSPGSVALDCLPPGNPRSILINVSKAADIDFSASIGFSRRDMVNALATNLSYQGKQSVNARL
jgi:hypothetical protein